MNTLKGWIGEKITTVGMWMFLDKKIYQRFHDVIIPAPNGTVQIDHLLISPFGLFVIETKNFQGWIFGSEKQAKWTQSIYGKKSSFQNPLRQNFRHTKCLAEYLELDHQKLHSIVFFIGESTFKTPMPPNVMRKGLSAYIKSYKQNLLTESQINKIVHAIQTLKKGRSLNHRVHMKSLTKRHESTTTCPKCGSSLLEKTAKKGINAGSKFLGCSGYPRCRYTKSIV